MAQHTGKVAWFKPSTGYGFLSRPNEPDTFVHRNAITTAPGTSLEKGDVVEFDIDIGCMGKPQATKVRKLSD